MFVVVNDINKETVFQISVSVLHVSNCVCVITKPFLCLFFPVKYERIKFLVIALKNAVEVYAWAPKPYHKFMAFKVETL